MDTAEFILNVERNITCPTYQPRFNKDDFLAFASSEQKITIVPAMLALNEEFFVVREVFNTFENIRGVDIPPRAPGRSIRKAEYSVDQGNSWYTLPRVEIDEANIFYNSDQTADPRGIFFMDDQIQLGPTPRENGLIAIYSEQRPSDLVQGQFTCTVVSTSVATFVVDRVPSNIIIGSVIDVTCGKAGFRILYKDLIVTGKTTTTLTVSNFSMSDPITNVTAGDEISIAKTTSIIQMPDEATEALIYATSFRLLQAQGIGEQAQIIKSRLDAAISAMDTALQPRNQNSLPKVMPAYGGLLGARRNTRRGWFIGSV